MRNQQIKAILIKVGLVILFLLPFIFYASLARAEYVCKDRVSINITSSAECGPTPTVDDCIVPTGCYRNSGPSQISCVSFTCNICCPDTDNQVRADTSGTQIIIDVPLGSEQETAQMGFNNWASGNNYQPAPEGYTMTGTLEGFVYNTAQGEAPGEVDLNLVYWKRGFYTKQGTAQVTPIENLGAGDASGTVRTGVGNAITDKFGEYESNAPELNTFTGQGQAPNAEDNISGLDSWSSFGPVVEDSIVTKITNFISSNPVLDVFKNSSMTTENPSCSFTTEFFGREIEFSFCPYEAHFLIMGSLILAMATLYSLFIVLGKG